MTKRSRAYNRLPFEVRARRESSAGRWLMIALLFFALWALQRSTVAGPYEAPYVDPALYEYGMDEVPGACEEPEIEWLDYGDCYVSSKDMKTLVREAEAQGWTVEVTGGGHYKWTPPDSERRIFSPTTPGDRRALKNLVAHLKRHGFQP